MSNLFKPWLHRSTCCILVNGQTSRSFNITRSIKQGGLLSMFFYVVANYDIHEHVNKDNCGLKYQGINVSSPTIADDTILLCNTANGLQAMINQAYEYGRMWRLTFSESKTKCLVFGESKYAHNVNSPNRKWFLGNRLIEEVSYITHVGNKLCVYNKSEIRTKNAINKGYATI